MRKWMNLFESTNSECHFIEVKPGEWWYLLDKWRPRYNEDGDEEEDHRWDWREDAIAEGPFKSEQEADQHLRNNHANPGGTQTNDYEEGYEPDELFKRKMEEAKERAKTSTFRPRFRF